MLKKIQTNKALFLETLFFIALIFCAGFISIKEGFSACVLDGVKLFVACVFPSLFPYLFITAILSNLRVTAKFSFRLNNLTSKIFAVGGSVSYALFLSLIAGYPVGAKTVSDLKLNGVIDQNESVRASVLCSSSSPVFLISSVGGIMAGDTLFGLKLFLLHVLTVLLVGFIFSFYKRKTPLTPKNVQVPLSQSTNVLYDGAYSAVISTLVVGALITLFFVLTKILSTTGVLTPFFKLFSLPFGSSGGQGLTLGIFECTQGLKVILSAERTFFTMPLCAFITGFGGLSVIAQSLAFLKKAKIKTAPFVLSKLTSAVLSFIFAVILNLIFGV